MLEILPIRFLRDEDGIVFGKLNLALAKLQRLDFPVADGFVITPPDLILKTTLEHFDFKDKELFEQKLLIVKKELQKISVPPQLTKYDKKKCQFLVDDTIFTSIGTLWLGLLNLWLDQLKVKIFTEGFSPELLTNLQSLTVFIVDTPKTDIESYYDSETDDVVINFKNIKIEPKELKTIHDLTLKANKTLIIPHNYQWILEKDVLLVGIMPYTPLPVSLNHQPEIILETLPDQIQSKQSNLKSTVKIFYDLSSKGLVIDHRVDGIFIDSSKIFDYKNPQQTFDELAFKLVESATTFKDSPIILKLADIPEKIDGVRGALRLIHQKSLFDPIMQAYIFARFKKSLRNIHLCVPYVRSVLELEQIKRELAAKGIHRKNSLNLWLEICVPENLINIEDYLEAGIDGVILNLDELISRLIGFNYREEEVYFYKKETSSLIKFLEDGMRALHKQKVPQVASGNVCLDSQVLQTLVEKGIHGLILQKVEVQSAVEVIRSAERKIILSKN